jgi:hypothetical protein
MSHILEQNQHKTGQAGGRGELPESSFGGGDK